MFTDMTTMAAEDVNRAALMLRRPGSLTGLFAAQHERARMIFAVLLLLAAALKTHALVSDRPASTLPAWVGLLVPALECALAIWLFSGAARVWASRAAVATLLVFTTAAGWALASGKDDCGCFGSVRVHPGWTFALDLTVLLALLASGRNRAEGRTAGERFVRLFPLPPLLPIVIPLILAGIAAGVFPLIFGRSLSSLFSPHLLSVEPAPKFSRAAREGETVSADFGSQHQR